MSMPIIDLSTLPNYKLTGTEGKPADTQLDIWIAHEQQDPLAMREISKLGKSLEQLIKEKQTVEKEGFRFANESLDIVRYQEYRPKPKLYLAHYKGGAKEFDKWFNGEQIMTPDGTVIQSSPPHLRSWCIGNNTTSMGGLELEKDVAKIRKHYEDLGKYSEIVELPWEKLKQER